LKAAKDRALSKPSGTTKASTFVPPRPLGSSENPGFGGADVSAAAANRTNPQEVTTLMSVVLFVTVCSILLHGGSIGGRPACVRLVRSRALQLPAGQSDSTDNSIVRLPTPLPTARIILRVFARVNGYHPGRLPCRRVCDIQVLGLRKLWKTRSVESTLAAHNAAHRVKYETKPIFCGNPK
jgi:hypothetical protein